jgi:tyrosine-specific transport protein
VEHKKSTLSAILLVAGTCIGGGMLALPIATGVSGFLPSLVVMAICWFAMTATALLLLEVSLWMKEGAHVITMTSEILGPWGKRVAWVLYLFICYASLVAYAAGGGAQMASACEHYGNICISKDMGALLFATIFTGVIFVGHWFVGRVNTLLFGAMIIAYFGLVGTGFSEVKFKLLKYQHWPTSLIAVPLLLTAFSFQTMVPSLTPYLKRNAKALRMAIIGGTFLAMMIYLVWQWIILGIVPVEGDNGLAQALAQGSMPATEFLRQHVTGQWVSLIAEFFAYFAIATSFLGIALGLFDFLADGLKIKKNAQGKAILGLLIIVPTLIIATKFERVFMTAMDASGGLGDTILNGIIPVLMVWKGRYILGYGSEYRLPGGKVILGAIALFFALGLTVEVLGILGWIPSVYDTYQMVEIHNPEQVIDQ